jgi:hypothetical protein
MNNVVHRTKPIKPWLSLPEAARKLELPRARVVALIRSGHLVAKLAAGRFWWVRGDSLSRYMARRRRSVKGAA